MSYCSIPVAQYSNMVHLFAKQSGNVVIKCTNKYMLYGEQLLLRPMVFYPTISKSAGFAGKIKSNHHRTPTRLFSNTREGGTRRHYEGNMLALILGGAGLCLDGSRLFPNTAVVSCEATSGSSSNKKVGNDKPRNSEDEDLFTKVVNLVRKGAENGGLDLDQIATVAGAKVSELLRRCKDAILVCCCWFVCLFILHFDFS